jgi:hypothetical protein
LFNAENDQQIQALFDLIIANNEQLEVVAHNVVAIFHPCF